MKLELEVSFGFGNVKIIEDLKDMFQSIVRMVAIFSLKWKQV